MTESPMAAVERLRDAINAHDLDAMVDCFAWDYRGETPTAPDHSFIGNDRVRRNWGVILAAVPDLKFEILRATTDGDVVWAEVEQCGTDVDGHPHLSRGVIVCQVLDGKFVHNRLYVNPVRAGGPGVFVETED